MGISEKSYREMIEMILKNGLNTYNKKTSNVLPFFDEKASVKKGKVFGFFSKSEMTQGVGKVYGSVESLLKDSDKLSHWTPNVFSWGGYTRNGDNQVKGHVETNLNQINGFVVDVDFKEPKEKISYTTLLGHLISSGLIPTIIVDTPKGYHVYYLIGNENESTGAFDKPSYISSANNYKSLEVAKKISMNLRKNLHKYLPEVDLGCNHFGIFRFPTRSNVVHFEPNLTSTFKFLLDWSIDFEKKENKKAKSLFKVIGNDIQSGRQIEAQWFKEIMHLKNIDKGNGLGRDNAIYTLSLACKQSKVTMDDCLNMMDEFNSNLNNPLDPKIVEKKVYSAYNGSKRQAAADYVNGIIETYAPDSTVRFHSNANSKGWYKFKKSREERTNVHYYEHKEDLLAYLDEELAGLSPEKIYLELTMKDISGETNIPLSTLKVILKQLKKDKEIVYKTKRGRGGKTQITSYSFMKKRILMNYILAKKARGQRIVFSIAEEFKPLKEAIIGELNTPKIRRKDPQLETG